MWEVTLDMLCDCQIVSNSATFMWEVTLYMLCDCVRLLVFQQHLCEK